MVVGSCLIDTAVPSKLHIPSNQGNSPNKGNPVINTQQIWECIILSWSNSS